MGIRCTLRQGAGLCSSSGFRLEMRREEREVRDVRRVWMMCPFFLAFFPLNLITSGESGQISHPLGMFDSYLQ